MSPIRRIAPLLLLLASPALAEVPDWVTVADADTVQVVTDDEDGSRRDTTVWLLVLDGQGYIRTGGTRWGANLQRDPQLELRVGDTSYPLRAEFVEDEPLRERVEAGFREKYGFSDAVIGLFRGGEPLIMRLRPRE
jgi:hypothetical protein